MDHGLAWRVLMHRVTMTKTIAILSTLAIAACGGTDPFAQSDEALSREAVNEGLLAFVNNPATDLVALDGWAGIDLRAAKAILQYRDGADGIAGTADDNAFDTIEELDAVAYVGPVTLQKLIAFAKTIGFIGDSLPGTYEGIFFNARQAETAVEIANRATPDQFKRMGLDARQALNIAAARPIANVAALAAVPYVGTGALNKIRAFVPTWNGGEEKNGAGALFDGIPFGQVDIFYAHDIVNRATYEQLVVLGGVYQYGAKVIVANRPAAGYTQFADVAALRAIGPNSVEHILALARSGKWVVNPGSPPASSLTEAQALEIARAALLAYFDGEFSKSPGYLTYFSDAKWTDTFHAAIAAFGTTHPLQEVVVTDKEYVFVGDLAWLYTEVGVSFDGKTVHPYIEID